MQTKKNNCATVDGLMIFHGYDFPVNSRELNIYIFSYCAILGDLDRGRGKIYS